MGTLRWYRKNLQRRIALHRANGPLQDFLIAPFPGPYTLLQDVDLVAVDIETTGLNPRTDSILNIGMVTVKNGGIHLDTAWQEIIQITNTIPEATTVLHQITDDQAATVGKPLSEVLPLVLNRLKSAVLLAHHAHIEQSFLSIVCQRFYGAPLVIPTIDTMALMRRYYERINRPIHAHDLRLFNLRKRYNLPRYRAHNALNDAVATAELFLAIIADRGGTGYRLRDFC